MLRLLKLPGGLAATFLAAICLNAGSATAGPTVTVGMKAAFHSPPYLLELLETAAEENATSYFPLLDRIASGHFTDTTTDKGLYDRFLDLLQQDGHISGPEALSTFKLALSMRSAAPRIEAHYQYYDTAVEPVVSPKDDCADWILLGGRQYCSASLSHAEGTIDGQSQTRMLPFDRALGRGPEAVLYADLTKPGFGSFHTALSDMARKGEVSYRLRYRPDQRELLEKLPVNGYGVELQLKRTDYIVIDDREGDSKAEASGSTKLEVNLDAEDEVADLKPLASSELSALGVKAASFIMESDDPFDSLLKLTQDFPKYSASFAAHNESQDFLREHYFNRGQMVPQGMNVLWMNGVQMIERQIDPYTLVDLLRRERTLIKGVLDLGLTGKQAVSLLGNREVTMAKSNDEVGRFDWRDEIEDGRVIVWLNNIEKDKRYAEYPTSLMSLMQRTMPGQIPPVRKDMFNLIVPVDLTNPEDIALVVEQLKGFITRLLPIRFGLVPLTPTPVAEQQAKIVYYLLENYGLASLMAYLESCNTGKQVFSIEQGKFEKATKDRSLREEATALSFGDIFESEHYIKQIEHARHWVTRLNAATTVPPIFLNGQAIPREESWLQEMSMKLGQDLQLIQQGIYYGQVNEDMWIPSLFLENAPTRRNVYIFPGKDNQLTVLDVNKVYSEHHDLFNVVPVIEASPDSSKETWAALSVFADFTGQPGLKLLLSALEFRRNNPSVRIDIIHNPTTITNDDNVNARLVREIEKLLEIENLETLEVLVTGAGSDKVDGTAYYMSLARFLSAAGFQPGAQVLLLNGRVVGPLANDAEWTEDDFQQLMEFEQASRILPVYQAVEALNLTEKVSGPLAAAKLTSITALSTISDLPEGIFESAPTLRTTVFDDWESAHTMISVGDESTANIHLVAVLNPASEQGQKWAPILKVLSELDGVFLRIFLNPRERIDELPVKRFYRYVLESAPTFDESGKVRSLSAKFKGIPSEALLNLGMDVQPAWLVAAKDSVHDLDNLKLSSIKSNVEATYELENILIEGHSRESSGNPPRGVQLLLGTESDAHFADTIIMANIGYFQFKANPGYYNIQLKEGRSSDIFSITSVGAKGFNAAAGDEGTDVALIGFQGTTLYPRLERKPGQELEDVLEETGSAGGDILSQGLKFAQGILGGKSKAKSISDTEHAEINIFSVASGHLYERMLNIMMVSVMKNTNHTVKFWFIEQFLSPSFKEFIPHLAEEYGFKYEMVTYKWPHWLRQQKEKQREIWGYKILFLDVLFPLSLDKVIFVDADQIVRTDMIDLVNLDLEGAPYGFTPMCDSRTEMEGFRFWKQGYWANYLRGLPYHISALYVVDLRRFRELAAGDRLRQQYHTLSADPASLSNLDQDLPNHMQFQIPIKSLPQEWLWCETWCSDESQKEARTIDLCNNPQTKEPKLDRARRQVPEWNLYDDEIAAVARRFKSDTITGEEQQKVLGGDEVQVEKNPKSRRFEEEPKTKTQGTGEEEHIKDEL
ncbi:UDP-glucose:glycoprotein glucosyltransferase [Truncatella angustata]|uniref:UDP-glucose:glycoprotein glucosyltransferase n=1 Tax=Truncatella angustata TaxID=152316 RepID=A0A9P8UH69_9PEZI|nr:UDP-glucose:glycoprotein glucosyltransferase [Truncatella angustata]KAH6652055.1 UDP-glucose:glycoprotein glucosyltransferase [Truncatella angustata]